jgi:hypothetical protein
MNTTAQPRRLDKRYSVLRRWRDRQEKIFVVFSS